jgi:hypothetical protein
MWEGIVFMIRRAPGQEGAFNVAEEWRPWQKAPLGQPLDSQSLFGFTTSNPTIYQVSQLD